MYNIVVGAAISRPRAIDNRPYIPIVAGRPVCVPYRYISTTFL